MDITLLLSWLTRVYPNQRLFSFVEDNLKIMLDYYGLNIWQDTRNINGYGVKFYKVRRT